MLTTLGCLLRRVRRARLADVSPRLAALADSALPVPTPSGAGGSSWAGHAAEAAYPTIIGLQDDVEILGTKTRPKRLWLLASDGRRISYLLKVAMAPCKGLICACTLVPAGQGFRVCDVVTGCA